jgi:hypothetical protein
MVVRFVMICCRVGPLRPQFLLSCGVMFIGKARAIEIWLTVCSCACSAIRYDELAAMDKHPRACISNNNGDRSYLHLRPLLLLCWVLTISSAYRLCVLVWNQTKSHLTPIGKFSNCIRSQPSALAFCYTRSAQPQQHQHWLLIDTIWVISGHSRLQDPFFYCYHGLCDQLLWLYMWLILVVALTTLNIVPATLCFDNSSTATRLAQAQMSFSSLTKWSNLWVETSRADLLR